MVLKNPLVSHTCPGIQKWAADLEGTELILPSGIGTDYLIQVYDKEKGDVVLFPRLLKHPTKIAWQQWVRKPHGYPGAQDPRETPSGDWEGYEIQPDRYRAVVIW